MRPQQWKPILVLVNLIYTYCPSLYRMALFAVRSELALVNVGVAVGASLAHVGEDWLHVALRAGDALVHAP
jgi:hypothetical protein